MTTISRINVTLSAFEGDGAPDTDARYEEFVTDYLRRTYPGAALAVSTAQGRTKVFAYRDATGAWDDDLSLELTTRCSTELWDDFCSSSDDDGAPSFDAALRWARSAAAGDYLVRYEDSGLTDAEDPGSRCGYGDSQLAELDSVLLRHGLTLSADDRGLVAAVLPTED